MQSQKINEIPRVLARLLSPAFWKDCLLEERPRWILWAPFLMGLGVVTYFSLTVEPSLYAGLSAVLLSGGLVLLSRRFPALRLFALILLLMCVGFASAQFRTQDIAKKSYVLEYETYPTYVLGQVEEIQDLGRNKGKARRVVLSHVKMEERAPEETPAQIRVQSYRISNDIQVGDWIKTLVKLRPPPPPVMPGGFDFQRYLFYQKIGAVGFTLDTPEVIEASSQRSFLQRVESTRLYIQRTIQMTVEGASGDVMAALTVGKRKAIPQEVTEAFRDVGLAHLLSISGLHIGLVAGLMFVALRMGLCLIPRFGVSPYVKKTAAMVGLLAAFFYLLLAGAPVPTQRAFLMTGVVLLAVLVDRRGISLRLVMLAAGLLILLTPEVVVSPSFQLSFAAVIALVAFYESVYARFFVAEDMPSRVARFFKYFMAIALTSLVAEAATTPFSVYHFNQLTLYNMLANVVVMPLVVAWVMPTLILSMLLLPLGASVAAPVLTLCGIGVQWIIDISLEIQSWPHALTIIPSPPAWGVLVMVAGGLWLCLWQKRWRLLGIPVILAGFLSVLSLQRPDVLVTNNGKLMAIITEEGMALSSRRREKFAADVWAGRLGFKVKEAGRLKNFPSALCGEMGCTVTLKNRRISYVWEPAAVFEECLSTDILITPEKAPPTCQAALILDKQSLRKTGSVSVQLSPLRVRTVEEVRGQRPWQPGFQW